jgi:CheY-like chemotaxis protein
VKVLIADDDDASLRSLAKILSLPEYELVVAKNGPDAWQIASAADPPRILLLDWEMPGMTGIDICRALRSHSGVSYQYIILVTGRSSREALVEGLEAGADDFISKPYSVAEMRARVRVGMRVLSTDTTSSGLVREALREAASSPGGEVVVRQGDVVGRIFVHEGRIAWAHVSTETSSLTDVLEEQNAVSEDDIQAVITECRQSGRNFGEVLVAWGLIDRERLRSSMRTWIAKKMRVIAHLRQPAVMFAPQPRTYSSDLTFAVDEVYPLEAAPPVPIILGPAATEEAHPLEPELVEDRVEEFYRVAPEQVENLKECFAALMRLDGALSVALFEAKNGACLGRTGPPADLRVVWTQMQALRSLDAEGGAEDLLLVGAQRCHILRAVSSGATKLVIYVVLHRNKAMLTLARHTIADLADRLLSAAVG